MTHIATMGTSSCATIAIAGFKKDDYKLNEEYNKDCTKFKLNLKEGMSVSVWYNKILHPVAQELGMTGEYPFELLMKTVDRDPNLRTKFTIITLNSFQVIDKDGYWPELLKRYGFEAIDKTSNSIGSINTVYTRNNNRVK